MRVLVKKRGNSASVRIPASVMAAAKIDLDQPVDVREEALSDQVKSFDWRARKATRKARATSAEMAEIRAKLRALIG